MPTGYDSMTQLRPFSTLGNVKIGAAGEVRVDSDFGNTFDDVLDWVHSSGAGSMDGPTEAEMAEANRAEMQLCNAIARKLAEDLTGAGFRRFLCMPNGHGSGYAVTVHDVNNRRYDVDYTYDQALEVEARSADDGFFNKLCDSIAAAVLGARTKYFARMEGRKE